MLANRSDQTVHDCSMRNLNFLKACFPRVWATVCQLPLQSQVFIFLICHSFRDKILYEINPTLDKLEQIKQLIRYQYSKNWFIGFVILYFVNKNDIFKGFEFSIIKGMPILRDML